MQCHERTSEIVHDLSLGANMVGSCLRFLVRSGLLRKDVGGHTVIVCREMFDLLSESAYAIKFARHRWPKRVFLFRHSLGGADNLLFAVRDPKVQRLADGVLGLT